MNATLLRARPMFCLLSDVCHSGMLPAIKNACLPVVVVVLALSVGPSAVGENRAAGQSWHRFRGPNGTGTVEADTVPAQWSNDDYNWKTELPGVGHSSPAIWNRRVFVTSAVDGGRQRIVLCLSTVDGRILWSRRFQSTPHRKHARNSFASPSPAVDAERVYVSWSAPEELTLMALSHDGQVVWRRNLGPYKSQHSCGTSPIRFGDLVILGNDQDGQSSLVAVDARTGEDRWRVPRRSERVAYSTPAVYEADDGPQLIFNSGAHGISSIDPQTGRTLWELDVFDKRTVSSPVVAGDLIVGTCGSGGGGNYLIALEPGSRDAVRPPKVRYKIKRNAPYVPTPLAYENRLYLWADNGVVSCLRLDDGKLVWRKRVGGTYSGSPICVAGRLYAISDEGDVVVLATGEKFQLLGKNSLGEPSRSTPAVADGTLYLRTYSHLFSVGGKRPVAQRPARTP